MFVAAREWFGKRVHAAVNGSGITRIYAGRVKYNANHIIIDCAGTSKLNNAIVSAKYTVAVLTTRLRHSAMDAKRSNAFANASAVKVTSLDVILNFSSGTTSPASSPRERAVARSSFARSTFMTYAIVVNTPGTIKAG